MSRKIEEENYLDFVKVNIELKKEDLEEALTSSAIGGAGPKSGRLIAEKHELRRENLPNPNEPYFIRVDLKNGETLYYGFATLTQARKSPPVPTSHPGVDHYLTYSRNNDGPGWSVLPITDFENVVRRVRFQIKNGKLINFEEEAKDFEPLIEVPKVVAGDQLREVMAETRTESLRPVGATLQADQFLITRETMGIPLTIQGPPGSGKTVVLLERLSRIAFSDKSTRDKGMLLVGPNQQFLEYVKEALEILGSSDVILSTPEELTNYKFSNNSDVEDIKYLKGFSVFTQIVDNYFKDLPSVLNSGYNLKISDIDIHFSVLDSLNLINLYRNETGTYQQIRSRAGMSIANLLVERFFLEWESRGKQRSQYEGDPIKLIQSNSTYRTILRNIFPEITAESVLKDLKKSPKVFMECAKRVLTEEQIISWLENVVEHEYEIREADVAILDYIDYKIKGNDENWGHIAVDEAQDLTPMQFMMLKRRTHSSNSITLTGDLAQATGAMFYETWDEITEYFSARNSKHTELTRSYRVPKEILDYANRFLRLSSAKVAPAEPFLEVAESFETHYPISSSIQYEYVESLIEEGLEGNQSILVVADSSGVKHFNEKFKDKTATKHFKAYCAEDVKGLEFDIVIIVNPLDIIRELNYTDDRLARLFYVITTRSTKKLHVVAETEEEILNPIFEFRKKIDSTIYSSNIELLKIDLEVDQIIDNEKGEFLENLAIRSIPKLCENFGLQITTIDPFMLSDNWFYLGMTNVRCVACGWRQQQVFRKHQLSSKGALSHPGALVCLSCLVARNGNEYSTDSLNTIDEELNFKQQVNQLCLDCQNAN